MKRIYQLLTWALLFASAPTFTLTVQAAGTKTSPVIINMATVNASGQGYAYYTYGCVSINENGYYTLTGATNSKYVIVQPGLTDVNITLDNVSIEFNISACAFQMSGARVNLTLTGDNTLTSGGARAGLLAPLGSTLTIGGTGRLTATAGTVGAGIGGGSDVREGGNITINSGTIIATGRGTMAAGIGAGIGGLGGNAGRVGGTGGNITINGGHVTAYGGAENSGAAGIGGGSSSAGGIITITGGTVFAYGGGADLAGGAGIGGGGSFQPDIRSGASGSITITGNANVTAKGGEGYAVFIGASVGSGAAYGTSLLPSWAGEAGTPDNPIIINNWGTNDFTNYLFGVEVGYGRDAHAAFTSPNPITPGTIVTYRDVTVTQNAHGTIAAYPQGGGSRSVPIKAHQTFTITPDAGYKVASVLVNGTNVGTPTSWTITNITTDTEITAIFEPPAPQEISPATYSSGPYTVNTQIAATAGTYIANDGGTAGTHTFQWYIADDDSGTNATAIPSATSLTYTPPSTDFGKYICIETTPVGSLGLTGMPVRSDYIQIGVMLHIIVSGENGGTATPGSEIIAYNTPVDIAVNRNVVTDAVVWSANPSVGQFADATAATTTYTPPSDPDRPITLTATLTSYYTVTVAGSHAAVNGAGSYIVGSTVTIYAGSRNEYIFSGWTTTSPGVVFADTRSATTTFTMPGNNVNVTANFAGIAPRITGPVRMTLVRGYTAASTGVFTVTGTSPTVRKTSGNDLITWNEANQTLDIAPGLPTGVYQVVLVASNIVSMSSTTFTLTVKEPVYYLDISRYFSGGTVTATTNSDNPYLSEEGQTVTLTITPDEGYTLETIQVYLYGTNTPIPINGTGLTRTFTMPAHHISVVAVFSQTGKVSIVETDNYPSLRAYVQNGVLYVSGLTAGMVWNVYNIQGNLIYQSDKTTLTGFQTLLGFRLPGRGVYLVTDGKSVVKIIH